MSLKAKKKKPFYKKWWIWLIAIILMVALGTSGENEENIAVDSTNVKETTVVNDTDKNEQATE